MLVELTNKQYINVSHITDLYAPEDKALIEISLSRHSDDDSVSFWFESHEKRDAKLSEIIAVTNRLTQ